MSGREDLDLYKSAGRVDRATIVRRAARVLGVFVGGAISLYGGGLYVLRCFSTCPADPAEDRIARLLTISIILFGLVVATAAVTVASRRSRAGLGIVLVLGCVIALFGIVSVASVPSVDAPGDHSGSTTAGIVAAAVGALSAGAAFALRRRGSSRT